MERLKTRIGRLIIKNPVILASGTFDRDICEKIDVNRLGAIVTKTITLEPRLGNPLPHIYKTRFGWLNSVGLKNPGLVKYLNQELPFWQKFSTEVITSIGGKTEEEYVEIAQKLENVVKTIEVNISCPNVHSGGLAFGTDPIIIKSLISKIRTEFSGNLIVKLSPNVTDITITAKAAIDAGADALTVANTVLALEIRRDKRIFHRITAGYSGPAIKPIAMKNVWQIWEKYKFPILASGGIENTDDALDFIRVGATAVQIGSANLLNPEASIAIVEELEQHCVKNNIKSLDKLKGTFDVA